MSSVTFRKCVFFIFYSKKKTKKEMKYIYIIFVICHLLIASFSTKHLKGMAQLASIEENCCSRNNIHHTIHIHSNFKSISFVCLCVWHVTDVICVHVEKKLFFSSISSEIQWIFLHDISIIFISKVLIWPFFPHKNMYRVFLSNGHVQNVSSQKVPTKKMDQIEIV